MFLVLGWSLVFALLALWSVAAWATYTVAAWASVQAGALPGLAWGAQALQLPQWLGAWVPAELGEALAQGLASLGPALAPLLEAMPSLVEGLGVLAWLAWGAGSALILSLGGCLHLLVRLLSPRRGAGSRPVLAMG